MSRLAVLLIAAAVAVAEPPKTHQIKLDEHTFTLPVGFTIEKIADRPLVDRPIVASFDDRGRLYVADSSGSNEKVVEQLKNPTHRLVRLEDTDGDGKFDKSTVFADKMMFPEGILWHRGHVYCAAPPHIWKLTDTDDDGMADKREIWFDGKTLTGCANDLHGPYLGPDGWIYWCKGAFAKQEYTLPNGKKFTTRASHIFRARPDGTGIEPVMTGGMDNPVDVAFLPNGERFFTTTFFQHPAAGKRDGLIHAVYGGIYGKDHDVTRDPDHKWTSPNLMPVMTHMGPAAPCGLHCYESDAFGKEYTTNLFACQFNLRKVSRHVLKPKGATYETEDSDFVVSDNTDFHPTDVIEDADGSLLIVDTGGWYKLCCPSSQLVKADVLGAIYRVKRSDAAKIDDPRGTKIAWGKENVESLGELLDDPRPFVRHRAIEGLASKGPVAIKTLAGTVVNSPTAIGRRNAVWTLTQIDHVKAREAVRAAVADSDPEIRTVVAQSISLWRDKDSGTQAFQLFNDENLIARRVGIEAMGRMQRRSAALAVITRLQYAEDRVMKHALVYMLIELGDKRLLEMYLREDPRPRIRPGIMTAFEQLKHGSPITKESPELDSKPFIAALTSTDAELRETAQWIIGRHPEWADQAAGAFREQLAAANADERDALAAQLGRLATTPGIQTLLAATVADPKAPDAARATAISAMAQSGLKTPPESWYSAIESPLSASTNKETLLATLAALRSLPPQKKPSDTLQQRLKSLWGVAGSPEVALNAMAAFPGGLKDLAPGEIEILVGSLHQDLPPAIRGLAAEVLSKAKLQSAQLDKLMAQLPKVSPLDIDRVLATFAQTKDDEIGKKLIAALNSPAVRPALRVDGVKERIKHFSPVVHKEAETLYAELNKEYAAQRKKLDDAVETLKPGDIRRGQALFNSTKTSCLACHTIGYVGGKQGPDLTKIGGIRTERDLLESILFPSASFVRSYEPVIVTTKDMKTYSGVPKKDAPDEMILVIAADKEVRIPREEIEEVRPGKVSIMPDGLDKQLSPQELADLIAFLRACK